MKKMFKLTALLVVPFILSGCDAINGLFGEKDGKKSFDDMKKASEKTKMHEYKSAHVVGSQQDEKRGSGSFEMDFTFRAGKWITEDEDSPYYFILNGDCMGYDMKTAISSIDASYSKYQIEHGTSFYKEGDIYRMEYDFSNVSGVADYRMQRDVKWEKTYGRPVYFKQVIVGTTMGIDCSGTYEYTITYAQNLLKYRQPLTIVRGFLLYVLY